MNKFLEDIFNRTSIKPADRTNVGFNQVYIADGFVDYEDLPMLQKHFSSAIKHGKEGLDEWPNGCWATLWITPGKIAYRGGINLSNNPDYSSRINGIKEAARKELLN